jgi:hypothetical protein
MWRPEAETGVDCTALVSGFQVLTAYVDEVPMSKEFVCRPDD